MAKVQRHLRGETNEVECVVHGHNVVEKGDIVWTYKISTFGCKTGSPGGNAQTADWYTQSVSDLAGSTPVYYDAQLAGIAMKGSIAGVTESIPVATSGVFRYPLGATTGVTIGQLVCGTTSAAATNYDQTVVSKASSELTDEYFCVLGYCVKTEAGATNVDFNLITRFSGVSYTTMKAF